MEDDVKDHKTRIVEWPDPENIRELTLRVRWLFMSGSNSLLLPDKERMERSSLTLEEAGDVLRQGKNAPPGPLSTASGEDLGRLLEELRMACRAARRQRRNFAKVKGLPMPEDGDEDET